MSLRIEGMAIAVEKPYLTGSGFDGIDITDPDGSHYVFNARLSKSCLPVFIFANVIFN
jgi:hypothetical protein